MACLGGAGALPFDSDRCSEERALIVVEPGEGNGSVLGAGLLDLLLSAWTRLAVDDESGSGSWAVFSSTPAMLHLGGFVGLQGGLHLGVGASRGLGELRKDRRELYRQLQISGVDQQEAVENTSSSSNMCWSDCWLGECVSQLAVLEPRPEPEQRAVAEHELGGAGQVRRCWSRPPGACSSSACTR